MALFIGGPLDGKLIEVDPTRTRVEVAIEHPIEGSTQKPNKLTDIFYYKREILECATMQYAIYVPRSYSCEDALTELIRGYHQSATQESQN
jgi:hypothetical protein